jgi:hypothetical protein
MEHDSANVNEVDHSGGSADYDGASMSGGTLDRNRTPTEAADLIARVNQLMELARAKHGGNLAEFLEEFRAYQRYRSDDAPDRGVYYSWQKDPIGMSGLTLVTMMRMVGPERAMEILFGEYLEPDEERRMLTELRSTVAELRRQTGETIEELRGQNRELTRRLDALAKRLPKPPSKPGR